jgi:hypothetical protein
MASTVYFVRVACAQGMQKSQLPENDRSFKKIPREATHKTNRTLIENSGKFNKIEYLDD